MMKQSFTQNLKGQFAAGTPKEGQLTKRVEDITAKVPSISYLALAIGSMALSAGIAAFTQKKSLANFVGLWVPSFMLIGIYNKLVKLEGHDSIDHAPARMH
jgi:hypothetical protein